MKPSRKSQEEKKHYSVDEMMDRLREVRSENDGRSRRRRGRSEGFGSGSASGSSERAGRGKKSQSIYLWIFFGLAGLFVLIVGGIFLLGFLNKLRYESESFRSEVSGRVSAITGMDTDFGAFQVDGKSLRSRHVQLRNETAGEGVRQVDVVTMEGRLALGSFFSDSWQIDPLTAHSVDVSLVPPIGDGKVSLSPWGGLPGRLAVAGFGLASEPKTISLENVRINAFSLLWGEGAGAESTDIIEDTRLTTTVYGKNMQFAAEGGSAWWRGLGPWKVQHISGQSDNKGLEVKRARLTLGEDDELLLSGKFAFKEGGNGKLKGTVARLPLEKIVPNYWKERLKGDVDAAFEYHRTYLPGSAASFRGAFQLRDVILRDLPVLDALAVFTAEPSFSFVDIPSIKGEFRIEGDVLTINGFEAQRAGLIRIGGTITVGADGVLGGVLDLGLPDATFDSIRGGRPSFFVLREDGFSWAKLTLGGTLSEPSEDLTPRVEALIRREQVKQSPSVSESAIPSAPAPAPGTSQGRPAAPSPSESGATTERERQLERAFDALTKPNQ